VLLQAEDAYPYLKQTGELIQAIWSEVGFKVKFDVLSAPILRQKRRDRAFHVDSMAASYRFDPDGWCSRYFLSTSPTTQEHSGSRNERIDKLIVEARQTADTRKRLELYTEIESLINEALPILYMHHLTLLEAGSMKLRAINRDFGLFQHQRRRASGGMAGIAGCGTHLLLNV
jgi:ABC-type transport system substrate-binding protein